VNTKEKLEELNKQLIERRISQPLALEAAFILGRKGPEGSVTADTDAAFRAALKIVQGAYALHGRPIIGNSDEVEAEKVAELIRREYEVGGSGASAQGTRV